MQFSFLKQTDNDDEIVSSYYIFSMILLVHRTRGNNKHKI